MTRPCDEPELLGQTVVVIGGSAGIGLETARRARAEGADVILTGRDPERLERAARRGRRVEHRRPSTPPTSTRLEQFFDGAARRRSTTCWSPAGGPYYAPLAEIDFDAARRDVEDHLLLPLAGRPLRRRARCAPAARCSSWAAPAAAAPASASALISALTAALPALIANLALELAPVRVNLIAAGFVDTPLSAALLGDELDARREQLRTTLPIRRVVGTGRRRRARRPHHDQHGAHRRDVRHRRRPAARRSAST